LKSNQKGIKKVPNVILKKGKTREETKEERREVTSTREGRSEIEG
jgi:hypothetical protein